MDRERKSGNRKPGWYPAGPTSVGREGIGSLVSEPINKAFKGARYTRDIMASLRFYRARRTYGSPAE